MPTSTNAKTSIGCSLDLKISDVYTPIAEVTDLRGPRISRGTHDVTHLDSPYWNGVSGTRMAEFIGSSIVVGEDVTIDGNFTAAEHTTAANCLADEFAKVDPSDWRITFVSTVTTYGKTYATFDGILTSFEPSAQKANPQQFSATIKVTGAVAFADAIA